MSSTKSSPSSASVNRHISPDVGKYDGLRLKEFKDNASALAFLRTPLSLEDINTLPLVCYGGRIDLVSTAGDLEKAVGEIAEEPVVGFDTESRPNMQRGLHRRPALMQLATSSKVYLVQLKKVPFSKGLVAILENPAQIKAGVGIQEDMEGLKKKKLKPAGIFDLGKAAQKKGLWSHGLRNLAANIFGCHISKGVRCSNWEREVLSQSQMVYAATDAWMGRMLFLRMRELGLLEGV